MEYNSIISIASREEVVPEWFDIELIKSGCEFFERNMYTVYVSCLAGLMYILAIPGIANTLNFTNQTGSTSVAFKRYYRTLSMMNSWYNFTNWNESNEALNSLIFIRNTHDRVAQEMSKFDNENNPYAKFSQTDMAVTQFAFMGPVLLFPHKFGVVGTTRQFEGLIHIWRVVGYMLGIDDEHNLCSGSYDEVIRKCKEALRTEIQPALENPSPLFRNLSINLINGMKLFLPFLDYEAFLKFSSEILNVANNVELKGFSDYCYWFYRSIFEHLLENPDFYLFLNLVLKMVLMYSSDLYKLTPNDY